MKEQLQALKATLQTTNESLTQYEQAQTTLLALLELDAKLLALEAEQGYMDLEEIAIVEEEGRLQ